MSSFMDKDLLLEELDSLETILLDVEKQLAKAPPSPAVISKLFQIAHNLKSSLAMMDRTEASAQIHSFETFLDNVRRGRQVFAKINADQALALVDQVSASLSEETEGKLTEILFTQETPAGDDPLETLPVHLKGPASAAIQKGLGIYVLEKNLSTSLDRQTILSLPFFDTIADLGELIGTFPDLDNIPQEEDFFILSVVFSSVHPGNHITDQIYDPVKILAQGQGTPGDIPQEEPSEGSQKPRLKILVLDDEEVERFLMQHLIGTLGDVKVTSNIQECLTAFDQAQNSGKPYDLVMLDLHLGREYGLNVVKEIRSREKQPTKILIVSADNDNREIMSSLHSSADHFIVKPLNKATLLRTLKKIGITF